MTPKERRYKTLHNWLLIEIFSTKAMKEEIGNKKSQPSGFVRVCAGPMEHCILMMEDNEGCLAPSTAAE